MRIGELARRTGIEAGTLRAWERRFGLLQPTRTPGGQRQYSEVDVARILTVRRLIDEGLTLGAAADRVVAGGDGGPAGEPETKLLQQILQTLDQGILVGKDARTRYVNRRAAQIFGCSVDELLTRSILDFIPDEERQRAKEQVLDLRQGVVRGPFDQRVRRPDGTTRVIEAHVRPMFDRAGRYEGSISVMRDVTEQRAAEAQDRFRVALLDAVGEALMATSSDGTVAYMNEAAEALWGWKAEEVVGKPVDAFPKAEGAFSLLEEMRAHAAAGEAFSCEIPTVRRDGTEIPCSFMMTPVLSPAGEVLGRIVVFRDLTEEKKRDHELIIRDLRAFALAVLGARAVEKGGESVSSDDAILHEIVAAACRLVGADRARILEVGDDGKLSLRAAVPSDEPATVPPGSGSLAGYVVLARRTVVVDDVATERRFDTGSLAPDTRSAIAAPVFAPGGVRGVLTVQSSGVRSFDTAAADFLQALANLVAVALK